MARQRPQERLLLGEELEARAPLHALERPQVGDRVHPVDQLRLEICQVAESPAAKEAQGQFPETPLDPRLPVGRMRGPPLPEFVIGGEIDEAQS